MFFSSSGYPGYSSHTSSYGGHHQNYHHIRPSEETSPPPVYEYLSSSRHGKDNFSGKFR